MTQTMHAAVVHRFGQPLTETDTKPGDWVVISGVGGLGHLTVQYAKGMALHVAAVGVADEKLALTRDFGVVRGRVALQIG